MPMNERNLEHQHHPEAIRRRLDAGPQSRYIADAVLGGIDGCVTTFAIVSGSIGAGFDGIVAVVLGFANLLADGFSMAVSNFEAMRAKREQADATRDMEHRHIDQEPEGEREEIRQIFRAKGFEGEMLERVVATITANRDIWVDTMLTEEHGLGKAPHNPLAAALTTMAAFVAVGSVPLLPYIVPGLHADLTFPISAALAAIMFFSVGLLKSQALSLSKLRGGASTLLTGGTAAAIAYIVGYVLRTVFST